jgi:hypothetical protein
VIVEGIPFTFDLASSGWTSTVGSIGKGTYEEPDSAAINLWSSAPDNVYADPCAHTPLEPTPDGSSAGLAAAVAAIPGVDVVTAPTSLTVDAQSGTYVAIRVRDDIACDPHDFYLWYDESTGGASGGWRWAAALGSVHSVWMFDIDGKLIWIDSETFDGAKPETTQEIQRIIESIRFG